MSFVPDPQVGAGKAGADVPHQSQPKNPADPPADPYAGKTNGDLHSLIWEKERKAERQRLIRELEGRDLPKRPEHPAKLIGERAKRLQTRIIDTEAAGRDAELREQFAELSSMFSDLLLHNAEGKGFDEKFGLMIALRAQRQAVITIQLMTELQELEKPDLPPGKQKPDERSV